MNINKFICGFEIFVVITIISIGIYLPTYLFSEQNKREIKQAKYESLLNKNIIIRDDTLKIVNYNIKEETIMLDNGTEISYKILEKQNK